MRQEGATLTRRRLLALGAYGALGFALPGPSRARAAADEGAESILSFDHLHTGEQLRTAYRVHGRTVPESLAAIDHLLRDHRTGEVHPIDPALLDLLHAVRADLRTTEPFQVISGYRSPATNAKLRARSSGVGRRSLHMQGRAIDVSVPGRDVAMLRRVARARRAGGVGYYPESGFVHIDVGRVRTW